MKDFADFKLDLATLRSELQEFKTLLDTKDQLGERKDVLSFFSRRQHLSAFIGSYVPYIVNFNRLAYEYDIFGDFACDLAVGDSKTQAYCFVEFEDATPDSIFVKRKGKASREWSPRFEHGFSQVLDWFWKLGDMENTREFTSRFGDKCQEFEGVLIVGRMAGLDYKEQMRLKWRRERVVANSKKVHAITYDELHEHLSTRLAFYDSEYQADPD